MAFNNEALSKVPVPDVVQLDMVALPPMLPDNVIAEPDQIEVSLPAFTAAPMSMVSNIASLAAAHAPESATAFERRVQPECCDGSTAARLLCAVHHVSMDTRGGVDQCNAPSAFIHSSSSSIPACAHLTAVSQQQYRNNTTSPETTSRQTTSCAASTTDTCDTPRDTTCVPPAPFTSSTSSGTTSRCSLSALRAVQRLCWAMLLLVMYASHVPISAPMSSWGSKGHIHAATAGVIMMMVHTVHAGAVSAVSSDHFDPPSHAPSLLRAEYQIRHADFTSPSSAASSASSGSSTGAGSTAARVVHAAKERYTAAVFHLHFDRPLYLYPDVIQQPSDGSGAAAGHRPAFEHQRQYFNWSRRYQHVSTPTAGASTGTPADQHTLDSAGDDSSSAPIGISVYQAAQFMRLHKDYRQILYGR